MKTLSIRRKFNTRIIEENERAEALIPVLAFDPSAELFYLDDSTLGFSFLCLPMSGWNETTIDRINTILNQSSIPDDTMITINLFRSPDISLSIARMMGIRAHTQDPFFKKFVRDRANFLNESTYTSIQRTEFKEDGSKIPHDLGYIHDMKLIISVKVPIMVNIKPTQDELKTILDLKQSIESNLDACRLYPRPIDSDTYLRLMQTMLNHGASAGWRFGQTKVDPNETINSQIFDYTTQIDVEKSMLQIGETYVKTLSAKTLPESTYFGSAMRYIGSHDGIDKGIKDPFLITANIFFPNSEKAKGRINKQRTYAINQAYGPLLKFVPVLGDKVRSFNLITDDMKSNRLIKMSLHVALFSNSKESLSKSAEGMKQLFTKRDVDIKLMEDSMMMLPVFLNCLPLCGDLSTVKDLFRYKTLTSRQCIPFLPLMGEWKGTGTGYLNLLTRNGQLLDVSVHDTGSNQNFAIFAQSGSGKSFLTNEICLSYMTEGASVWIIDVGRSYEKLCEAQKGQFIHFGDNLDVDGSNGKPICLNPFPLVQQWDDEENALIGLIESMASTNTPLTDLQRESLKKIMAKIWRSRGTSMNIDHITEDCLAHADKRVQDIGTQLHSFTSDGAYGKHFIGENNVSFDNKFVVLELEELKSKPHLQRVVLLQLIYQIQQAVYLGKQDHKKFVLIDEAWDLLNKEEITPFIESAYRRFRKYRASMGVVTQSLDDLFTSSTGKAIFANSATTFTLAQKTEVIQGLKENKRMDLNNAAFELLKTVRTCKGAFSEIFIKSEFSQGIGRLIVSPFQVLLYSTAGEDKHAIQTYLDRGLDLGDAINQVLRDRGLLNDIKKAA